MATVNNNNNKGKLTTRANFVSDLDFLNKITIYFLFTTFKYVTDVKTDLMFIKVFYFIYFPTFFFGLQFNFNFKYLMGFVYR